MNHWPFVIAAYAITLIGTALLVALSWRRMRRLETRAEKMKR